MTFLTAVKNHMGKKDISTYRAAKETKWSQSYIWLVLNGQRNGSIAFFKDMSKYTGVSLDLLKEESNN